MRKVTENSMVFLVLVLIISSLVFMIPELLVVIAVLAIYAVRLYVFTYVYTICFPHLEVIFE